MTQRFNHGEWKIAITFLVTEEWRIGDCDFFGFILSGDDGDDDNGALYQGALVVCYSIEGERKDTRLIKSS